MSGERPVTGHEPAKAQVLKAMGVSDWEWRDLRRTATTIMAKCGVARHVADKMFNHTTGTIQGVAGVYNRFQYREGREEALDALGRFVMALVHPETAPANVVALQGTPAPAPAAADETTQLRPRIEELELELARARAEVIDFPVEVRSA